MEGVKILKKMKELSPDGNCIHTKAKRKASF